MSRTALRGLAAVTFITVVLVLALFVGGAAGGHGKGKHKGNNNNSSTPKTETHGRVGFHFLVLDAIAGGASDRMIIQGDGSFNGNEASGGGTFDHFLGGTGPPATLVATGTWKADDVVSWKPGSTHGVYQGGILVINATVKPNGKPAIKNVMIQVDCNLGPANFSTGNPEGVVVTFPGTPTVKFTPTNPTTGVTVFSTTKGHKH
jgi:hypothetical protein